MQKFIIDAPKCVTKVKPGMKDHWLTLDASELYDIANSIKPEYRAMVNAKPEWHGGNFAQALEWCRTGDMSAVEKSDALLSEMSKYMPESARRGYVLDVAGAVPSVPDYIAGSPLNMRRRIKLQDEYAPLAIVYDPTCSATVKPAQIFQRGIVALALVRALAGTRPIELWVMGGLDAMNRTHAGYVACRVETAPLDLARAAFMLTSTSYARAINYKLLHQHFDAKGAWPYNNHALSLGTNFREIVRQAFPHVSDVLAIPAIFGGDPMLYDPKAWLERTMAELTGQMQEAA